jgi:uncharacterized YccA/Bax inhibitor family protein
MRTANPALTESVFDKVRPYAGAEQMTVGGTVNRTAILFVLLLVTAGYVWATFVGRQDMSGVMPYLLVGAIGGLIVAIVTVFKKEWSAITAPIYALLEGLAIGGLSILMETRYPGIVIQAVGLTFGVLAVLLLIWRTGMITVTQKFRMGVFAATGGVALIYLATMGLGFFGIHIPYIHEGGFIGIGFSLVVIVIASLNLILDFDFIERGAEKGAPKYMEWYAAFGLMVTLIWLYIEILRLLAKLRRR